MRPYRFVSVAAVLLLAACGRAGETREEFDAVVLQARAQEGELVLKQVWALQQAYRATNQRYATTFDELRAMGWENPVDLKFYQPPRIVRAGSDEVCIVIEPVPGQPNLWPHHVDQTDQVQRGPCP
jgi:hypothetical protein